MKKEIVIPQEYAEIIKAEAERQNMTVDEVVHTAFRNFLERSKSDAGN